MPETSDPSAVAAIVSGGVRRRDRLVSHLEAAFRDARPFDIIVARSSDEATEAARVATSSAGLVIAVGGDGTAADVATGICGSQAILGIVPAGSTNIIAKGLGIPSDPAAAIRMLAASYAIRAIDVGRCGERCFLHMAGAGFDAEIFRASSWSLKRAVGWLAYLPAAARSLRVAPSHVRVTVDERELELRSPLVLVANGGAIVTPSFELVPGVSIDDGLFDVLVFATVTPAQIVAALGLTGLRRLHRSPRVHRLRGREVRIESEPPLALQLDGDVRGQTPATFSLVHHGLRVAVPVP